MRTRATELEPLSRSTSGLLIVVGRGQLTDRAWARIEPLLPVSAPMSSSRCSSKSHQNKGSKKCPDR